MVTTLGDQKPFGQHNGDGLQNQRIQCRPEFKRLVVAALYSPQRTKPIAAFHELFLEPGLDFGPFPPDIPHVAVGGIVLATFTHPFVRSVQYVIRCDLLH